MKPDEAPRVANLLLASDVADALGISRQTVSQMIHNGDFKTLQVLGEDTTKKPLFVIKRHEVEKMKETRSFPRAGNKT